MLIMKFVNSNYFVFKSNNILYYSIIIGIVSFFLYTIPISVSATELANYTNDKLKIQFQYPSNWTIEEKNSRFDEGSDISIQSNSISDTGLISIVYTDNLVEGFGSTDLRTGLYAIFKESIGSDYSREYRVIEKPSFITIGGVDAGTFLFTDKDKYEDYALKWATQRWIILNNDHGYLISYMSSADTFDNAENTSIRDLFIKSIKFLGNTEPPPKSRFD